MTELIGRFIFVSPIPVHHSVFIKFSSRDCGTSEHLQENGFSLKSECDVSYIIHARKALGRIFGLWQDLSNNEGSKLLHSSQLASGQHFDSSYTRIVYCGLRVSQGQHSQYPTTHQVVVLRTRMSDIHLALTPCHRVRSTTMAYNNTGVCCLVL